MPRTFPTLREAEIAYNELEHRIALLERQKNSAGERRAAQQPPQITQIFQNTTQPTIDIDSNNDNGKIVHHLDHIFMNYVITQFLISKSGATFNDPLDPDHSWSIDLLGNTLRFLYTNLVSGETFQMEFRASDTGSSLAPRVFFQGDLGELLDPIFIGHFANLRVLANTPTPGDVLTAVDADGNVEWASGGGGGNSSKYGTASSSQAMTTSYVDIAGCSVSLDVDGRWLVIGTAVVLKSVNDDYIEMEIVYDGTPQTPRGYHGESTTTQNLYGNICISRVVTVSGQPKTAKLQAKKNSGAGGSITGQIGTQIEAVYLGA